MQLELEQKLKLNENAIARLQTNHKSVLVRGSGHPSGFSVLDCHCRISETQLGLQDMD